MSPDQLDMLRTALRRNRLIWQLNTVWSAYQAGEAALARQELDAESIVRTRWGLGPAEPPSEYTDETGRAPDFGEDIGDLIFEARMASGELRVAFLITLFHAYERQVMRFLGTKQYDHDRAMDLLRRSGMNPDAAAIETVQIAANAAKHGEGRSMELLRARRPELVDDEGDVRLSREQFRALAHCLIHIPAA